MELQSGKPFIWSKPDRPRARRRNFTKFSEKGAALSFSSGLKMCIDTKFTPLKPSRDKRELWRSDAAGVVPVSKPDRFSVRPELITFEPIDVLIEPSQSVGRWYREALNKASRMTLRLPRPELFTISFNDVYNDAIKRSPCFGAIEGISSDKWWYDVIKKTYKNTETLTNISEQELEEIMPQLFDMIYTEIFSSADGWIMKENALYLLEKLKEWKDIGNGPKIGVISNFDDRMTMILRNVGLDKYFDFVLTSYECKQEKPNKDIFNAALKRAKLPNASGAYHVGYNVNNDIYGAIAAGFVPLHINEWFDEQFPDWTEVNTIETAEIGAEQRAEYMKWGRKNMDTGAEWYELWGLDDVLTLSGLPQDDSKTIKTTYIRGYRDD